MKRQPFNSNDPFDQLAELAKREIAEAGLRILRASQAANLPDDVRIEASIAGMFTGICGVAQSNFGPSTKTQRELLKYLVQIMPWAFDQARSVRGLPPLNDEKRGRTQ